MLVMIDTNIIISAALNPVGKTCKALLKALNEPYTAVVSNYVLDELHRKLQQKFPDKASEFEALLHHMLRAAIIVPTPSIKHQYEDKIRDIKDRPIYRAALCIGADYILTGDKDFHEAGIQFPRIISVQEFLAL